MLATLATTLTIVANVGGAKRGSGRLADSPKIPCWYSVSGLNYKNGTASSCPRQADQLFVTDDEYRPSKIINSEGFREHRKDLYEGMWPLGCKLCKETEKFGNRSMRTDHEYDGSFYNVKDGTIELDGLKHIELRFSNACNMACLHCSEVFSSQWMKALKNYEPDEETKNAGLKQLTKEEHRHKRDGKLDDFKIKLTIPQVDSICDDLIENFPNIKIIDFAGGEVLIQKQFYHTLERLKDHPNASNIRLLFHSNFNADFDPVKLAKLLEPFGERVITISLDAGKNIYSYFRDGDWSQMENNIDLFRKHDQKTELCATITTSAFQMLDLENVFESIMTLPVDNIDHSIVQTPYYLDPSIVMKDHSDIVYQQIDKVKQKIEKSNRWKDDHIINQTIEEIEKYVTNIMLPDEYYDRFKTYIKKTNTLFNKDFNKAYKYLEFDGENIRNI